MLNTYWFLHYTSAFFSIKYLKTYWVAGSRLLWQRCTYSLILKGSDRFLYVTICPVSEAPLCPSVLRVHVRETQACVRVSSPPAISMYSFSNDGIGIFVVHMVRACVFARSETETISESAHNSDSVSQFSKKNFFSR